MAQCQVICILHRQKKIDYFINGMGTRFSHLEKNYETAPYFIPYTSINYIQDLSGNNKTATTLKYIVRKNVFISVSERSYYDTEPRGHKIGDG